MPVTRFGVSLEEELLEALDLYVNNNKYSNRSQAVRQLIERNIVERKWQCNNIVAGALVIIYDHHKKDIPQKSNNIKYDYHEVILSSQLFHLSPEVCMEIIALKGEAMVLTEFSDKIIGIKGLKHGKLIMSKAE